VTETNVFQPMSVEHSICRTAVADCFQGLCMDETLPCARPWPQGGPFWPAFATASPRGRRGSSGLWRAWKRIDFARRLKRLEELRAVALPVSIAYAQLAGFDPVVGSRGRDELHGRNERWPP
jgi:hypothetical protein